ncbi:MAG: BrnT family toxin [Roseomonas sp.]|nr:BrnT family toxin [Roseomonas sp.]
MEIEWDERKRLANIAKHGLDFEDADLVFEQPHLVGEARAVGDETRHCAIGYVGEGLVAVIYTMRGEAIRIISMRKARDNERRRFHQEVHGR